MLKLDPCPIRNAVHQALRKHKSLWMAAPAGLLSATLASAQVIQGNVPSVNVTLKGANGTSPTSTDGAAGGNGQSLDQNPLSVELASTVVSSGAVTVASTGGKGGDGGGRNGLASANGGDAGNGGNGGPVALTLDAGATVSSGGVSVESIGGAGGQGGGHGTYGRTGAPGAGGVGGNIGYVQSANTSVTNGTVGGAGVLLLSVGSTGGDAGNAQTFADTANGPNGGSGGDGGAITASGISGAVTSAGAGLAALSIGGGGGQGGQASGGAFATLSPANGGNGGQAGAGGAISLSFLDASITASGSTNASEKVDFGNGTTLVRTDAGIVAASIGGVGNTGGFATASPAKQGASSEAGDGGAVNLTVSGGTIMTTGVAAPGILAQSAGGAGGDGVNVQGFFHARSGGGGAGGIGGAVSVTLFDDATTLNPAVITTGQGSDAIVAQSLGGGGGYGGTADTDGIFASVAIGGPGGTGGASSAVTVDNGVAAQGGAGITLSTHGDNAGAITAQSIAGGGGRGGNSVALGIGFLAYSVGGTGGAGGMSGPVTVDNDGTIQTLGERSYGVLAQSIGGGGGNGGSGFALDVGVQASVALAVGGNGGAGGVGGVVVVSNEGQIVTSGANSYGIVAQSIGGGGGVGGSSVAATVAANDSEFPSLNMQVSVGGSGGQGGTTQSTGSTVSVTNSGLIMTQGLSATGVLAQSIAGGGGDGGDAGVKGEAVNSAFVTVNSAIGGSGALGGAAGAVNVINNGVIVTLADMADGIDAESIGGGGGNGGYGRTDSGTLLSGDEPGLSLTLSVGGRGGAGGSGGNVMVSNTQSIVTRGNDASGIHAQSIGGGGGNGGASLAAGSGGSITVNLAIGGGGGNGNVSGTVTVDNSGNILTGGGSSNAIFAQSIGGGGGSGGNASTSGATDPQLVVGNFIAKGLGIGTDVVKGADDIYTLKGNYIGDLGTLDKLQTLLDSYNESNAAVAASASPGVSAEPSTESSSKLSLTVGGGISGAGGAGNNGNQVTVVNTGNLQTLGPNAVGIIAQSVGGGGGNAGITNVASPNSPSDSTPPSTLLMGVGGGGGAGGDGGAVSVVTTGSISTGSNSNGATVGDTSFGIEAQSIGGGGGSGGASTAQGAVPYDVTLSMGGSGGATGAGNNVTVTFNPAAANNNITTLGADAIGIVAQSIGGGGGVEELLTVNSASGGSASSSSNASINLVNLKLNGAGGAYGGGAAVTVNLGTGTSAYGYLQTSGRNAYGVLAQSIGGGGGLQIGTGAATSAQSQLQSLWSSAAGANVGGDGYTVGVNLDHGFNIGTYGAGAAGIIAQSIGAGGGLFGGLDTVDLSAAPVSAAVGANRSGQGGNISISLSGASAVATQGANAPAILAQSFGEGGGILGTSSGGLVFVGAGNYNSCSPDCTGTVDVTVDNSSLAEAFGKGSYGVYAQSLGNGTGANVVAITVGYGSVVRAVDSAAAAILVDGGDKNTITIESGGTVEYATKNADGSITPDVGGIAIQAAPKTIVNNSGTLTGQIQTLPWLANSTATFTPGTPVTGGITLNNYAGATVNAGSSIDLQGGTFTNLGTLEIGGSGKIAQTTINGSLLQGSGGVMAFDANFQQGQADKLLVNGTVELSGEILIRATTLTQTPVTLIEAQQILTAGADGTAASAPPSPSVVRTPSSLLFSYATKVDGANLVVTPQANFTTGSEFFNTTQNNLTQYLQRVWNSNTAAFGSSFAALQDVKTSTQYVETIKSLTGEGINAIDTMRLFASYNLVSDLAACGKVDGTQELQDDECAFSRLGVTGVSRSADSNFSGFGMTLLTAEFGFRREVAPDWFVGVSSAYEHSNMDTNDHLVQIEGNSALVALSIMHRVGPWRFSIAADGGYGWYKSTREVGVDGDNSRVSGCPSASNAGLHGKVSYDINLSRFYLRPQIDVQGNWLHTGSYQEQGSDLFDLTADASDKAVVSATPALEIGSQHAFADGSTGRIYAVAGVTQFSNDDWNTNARFTAAPSDAGTFHTELYNPRTAGRFGAGLQVQMTNRLNVGVEYDAMVASHIVANSGVVRGEYHF